MKTDQQKSAEQLIRELDILIEADFAAAEVQSVKENIKIVEKVVKKTEYIKSST